MEPDDESSRQQQKQQQQQQQHSSSRTAVPALPPPDAFDIACAIDALSCVESGDPSVLNLIKTAYELGIDVSSSSTSSNCSTSSFDEDDNDEVASKNSKQSDDEDLNDDYPVDPLKVAALSSAFSSHHISPKRSKMRRVTNFNQRIEPQQMAQFLLPLFTSQTEEIYPDPHSAKIKHEDILQVLTGGSADLNSFEKRETVSSSPSELNLLPEEKEILLQVKTILSDPELHNVLRIPLVGINESELIKKETTATAVSLEPGESPTNQKKSIASGSMEVQHSNNSSSSDDKKDSKHYFIDDMDKFLKRSCCVNKCLAGGGKCPSNECHKKWQYIKDGLIKYILLPNQFGFNSTLCDDPFDDINVPQMIFDCDSLNTSERFVYGSQNQKLCPGGCANRKPCKHFVKYVKSNGDKPEEGDGNRNFSESEILDEQIKCMDLQSAWHELKILLLWLYWASNKGLDNLEELAIGFQTTCHCCYCFHAKVVTRLEKLKFFNYVNFSVKDSSSLNARCICRKKKVVSKGRSRTKTRFKSDLHGKESAKCQYCSLNSVNEQSKPSLEPMKSKLTDYLQILGLPVVRCCCQQTRTESESLLDEDLPLVFVCSKKYKLPFAYVDLLSGEEFSTAEVKSKVPSSAMKFYISSCEKWWKEKELNSDGATGYTCERCRCTCNNVKFYNLPQIINRITEIVDNFARLSMTFLLNKMDIFYSSLCSRYGAHLLAVLSSGCGFTFLKELSQVVRTIRNCGLWLMQILGPSRLRLAFTIYFTLPGQHFLGSIYWQWADAPALHNFLKLSVMLAHDTVIPEWRDILIGYLDILPYLHDAAALSDVSEIFSLARLGVEKDEHLIKMYQHYNLIQKQYLNKFPAFLNFPKTNKEQPENPESSINNDPVTKFSKDIVEYINDKISEIEILSEYFGNPWNDFETLLAYAMIKSYASGDCANNEYLKFWIEKVFFSRDPTDNNVNNHQNIKLSLQILIDLMACHKNVKKSKEHISLNQILMDPNLDRVKNLIKLFHIKHLKRSRNKCVKINVNINRYLKFNKDLLKKEEKCSQNDSISPNSKNENNSSKSKFHSSAKQKFKAVNILVDFFNSLYNNNSSVIPQKSTVIPETVFSVDSLKSGDDVDIPENFNYDSSDDVPMNSDIEENVSQMPNDGIETTGANATNPQVENTQNDSKIDSQPSENYNNATDQEKWSLFTAQILSNLVSKSSVEGDCKTAAATENSIIAEFIEKEFKQLDSKKTGIKNSATIDINASDASKIVKFDHSNDSFICEIDSLDDFKSKITKFLSLTDENLSLICNENLFSKHAINSSESSGQSDESVNESKMNLKNHLKYSNLVEMEQLCDMYDSMSFEDKKNISDVNNLSKRDHLWDPSIEEIEEEMLKLKNRGKTKEDFEQDLHIICFQLVTRNMLQALMPLEKDVPYKEKPKVTTEKKCTEVVTRKRKLIDGFSVDDYWVSIKSQFEKWRIIAMKMYTNLISINKMTEDNNSNKKNIGIDFYKYFQNITSFIKGYQLAVKLNLPKSDSTTFAFNKSLTNISIEESSGGNDPNKASNIYVETCFYALKEIERFEKKIKSSINNESTPEQILQAKKHFEETREAELLGGRGLSKMINKCSKKSTPTTTNSYPKTEVKKNPQPDSKENVKKDIKSEEKASDKKTDNPTVSTVNNANKQEKSKTTSLTERVTSSNDSSKQTPNSSQEHENKLANSKSSNKPNIRSETKSSANSGKSVDSAHCNSESDAGHEAHAGECKRKGSAGTIKDRENVKIPGSNNQDSHEKCLTEDKCLLHPDPSRHLQSGEHPCNCCYCTVFGQVPPLSSPVSRNFNETRERLRTILNKKKLSGKPNCVDKTHKSTVGEADVHEIKKTESAYQQNITQAGNVTQTNSKPNPNPVKVQANDPSNNDSSNKVDVATEESTKCSKNKTNVTNYLNRLSLLKSSKNIGDNVKTKTIKKPSVNPTVPPDVKPNQPSKPTTNSVESKSSVSVSAPKKNTPELKKENPKNQPKSSNSNSEKVTKAPNEKVESSRSTQSVIVQNENPNGAKSIRCHSCSRVEVDSKQAEVNSGSQNSSSSSVNKGPNKNNEDHKLEQSSILNKFNSLSMLVSRIPSDSKSSSNSTLIRQNTASTTGTGNSIKSRDSSYCSSPACSGCCWSGYKDDRDVNMLVKFIEEPHRAADKEKKQAKKARQRNKKLKMELLKERDELHEDLISMVGETSRLREEVVRLEQGLASACRRLPPANKCLKRSGATDNETDIEERECALLLKRAAQEASARATEAATLAEHAHSRLRHVETALNLLSTSVNRVCVKQQKLSQTNDNSPKEAATPIPPQSLPSVYNMDHMLYNDVLKYKHNDDLCGNSGGNQGMVTIKRVLLPNSDEHGVTITPKGSDQLVYTSQDHTLNFSGKQPTSAKKQNLSWEATLAQINSLAHTKKKPKIPHIEKSKPVISLTSSKDVKIDASKKRLKEGNVQLTNNNPKNEKYIATTIIENTVEKNEEPMSKKALKKIRKAAMKADTETTNTEVVSHKSNKFDLEPVHKENRLDEKQPSNKKAKNANKNTDAENLTSRNSKVSSIDNKTDSKKGNNSAAQKVELSSKTQIKNANIASKSNKTTNVDKNDNSKSNTVKEKSVAKGQKSVPSVESNPQVPSSGNKGKKSKQQQQQLLNQQQQQQQNQSQKSAVPPPITSVPQKTNNASHRATPPNPQSSMQIVSTLSSAVDKIKLNDDTTIELANTSSKKDATADSNDLSQINNKNAPVSSSIMEQLRSGVQFADLRLPPGITLTRVDPAKQHSAAKPSIPLMTPTTPNAYRPTPPAPPPPAVIMVDTTKLHADRESKGQAPTPVESKKSKSKKSKKKNKKIQHHLQQTSGTTSTHTSTVNNASEDQPRMVTLRNPMFHSTLATPGMPTMQTAGKRVNDIRIPDPIPMPPSASCQATITPTSNGMYTIRNPLMSIVHQQSMMGMNSMENVPNPLLLMANQHLSTPTPHSYCANTCDDQNLRSSNDRSSVMKEPINNLSNRMSECSLETCKDNMNNYDNNIPDKSYMFPDHNPNKFSAMPHKFDKDNGSCQGDFMNSCSDEVEKHNVHITPSPIGATRFQEHRKSSLDQQVPLTNYENPIQKPIGTPFTQFNIPEKSKAAPRNASVAYSQVDLPEPQKLYTPFGPTDPDKTFGSILYQPFARDQSNENIWSTTAMKTDVEYPYPNEDKAKMSPYVHRLGNSRVIVNSDNTNLQQLDVNEQLKTRQSKQIKPENLSESSKSHQNNHPAPSSHPSVYQQLLCESNKESLAGSKPWNNGAYSFEHEYYKYYNQFQTGVSPHHNSKLSHSSSSSCVPSDTSSVYDSISNSSSNSPADSTNVANNPNQIPELSYVHQTHQMNMPKSGTMYNPTDGNFGDMCNPVHQESFNSYPGFKTMPAGDAPNVEKHIPNMWTDGIPQFKDMYGVSLSSLNASQDGALNYDGNKNPVGHQSVPNGMIRNEKYFTDSDSIFAPDQSITNLNELDSSERDIESFKRFDFYFEPPKNKPKISLNVQDIAFQRPSPTKPLYRNK